MSVKTFENMKSLLHNHLVYICAEETEICEFYDISLPEKSENLLWDSSQLRVIIESVWHVVNSGLDKLRAWRRSGALEFLGTHILPYKKEKFIWSTNFQSNRWNNQKGIVSSKYYCEQHRTCNILMFIYSMMSKLIFLHVDCETINF